MRREYESRGRRHRADVEDLGDGRHRVRWALLDEAGREETHQVLVLDVREAGDGRYAVLCGDEVHDVGVERDGDRRTVAWGDGAFGLTRLDPSRPRGALPRAADGPATVSSPIPGRVVRVAVRSGDSVKAGDAVVVLEAMKMANELRSPMDGRVAAVRVAVGDAVDAGASLVTVEPASPA